MATGFFALLDDIAMLMDDVAVASKTAMAETAGILGDDLAVNAEQAVGFESSRELPVLWSIAKGSLLNKAIIVPLAFLFHSLMPSALEVVLLCGAGFLAYEGAEKVWHKFHAGGSSSHANDSTLSEAQKIRAATDRDKTIILADAYKEAERIRGEGDAKAVQVYARSYSSDPKFYEFVRTLDAYKKVVDDKTTLVLPSDSKLFKLLIEGK